MVRGWDTVRSPSASTAPSTVGDLRDALALAAAIAVVGASFGALAAAGGVPPLLIVAMSVLVFAGGAQFLVVAVVASGGSVVAAVAAGFLLNLRLLPFGLAMGETVGGGWLPGSPARN